jgi:hypothetical protein
MNDALIQKLKKLARRPSWQDHEDFNPEDYSGGNFDDAFDGGVRSGETWLAREILDDLGISWEE